MWTRGTQNPGNRDTARFQPISHVLESLRAYFLSRKHLKRSILSAVERVREDEVCLLVLGGVPTGRVPAAVSWPLRASRRGGSPQDDETALVQRPTLTSNSGKFWGFAIRRVFSRFYTFWSP